VFANRLGRIPGARAAIAIQPSEIGISTTLVSLLAYASASVTAVSPISAARSPG
jgi:hypothetical protein